MKFLVMVEIWMKTIAGVLLSKFNYNKHVSTTPLFKEVLSNHKFFCILNYQFFGTFHAVSC